MGHVMACYVGLCGILTQRAKSTDHPSVSCRGVTNYQYLVLKLCLQYGTGWLKIIQAPPAGVPVRV